ncbi:hypothetical protein ABB37_03738 [Leptomonas pyrrhocoris]|uniref:Small acidic protein n=1 Tax=Leptomonas pyrrhocoris TaxID=157538 RepID=A0A0M9G395_LEPPY|nr:hypothetical protein ABB37_03738 [Leptomonas pyrrhocoris]XP_015659792.1 hypothetical protein ABB37_03738 [Leptomonas pyrrhocoris]KPA81352.1 hypothetical protein ABB37_03738 [Leptomonas pyrrhocoris]KPA81353.1 hypothetical protein ABB37_03738 [Leptomonas pyrrhocoris]|eukprot:XP_015659791.1 hypothetical protein ABB37_03738 [Leptomonas pyrrhocoris]
MSSLKDYIREVRDAAAEHLESRHRDDASSATQRVSREEALASIALVTIRLLEQQLQSGTTDDAERKELQMHLKACRKALKSHPSSASLKRSRAEYAQGETAASSSAAVSQSPRPKTVELGQYSATGAFGHNEEKRMKFARLMGGAKAAAAAGGGDSNSHPHHNTHAKNSAEVRRMNENLEREFESAMSHKGKKGLGA